MIPIYFYLKFIQDALINGSEEIIRQTAAWSLGQIGYHSNDHARAMAESDNPAIAVLLGVSNIFFKLIN